VETHEPHELARHLGVERVDAAVGPLEPTIDAFFKGPDLGLDTGHFQTIPSSTACRQRNPEIRNPEIACEERAK